MPIFDLIQTLSSKHPFNYNEFIKAYNELLQMKKIKENLEIISNCLLSEYSENVSKCLDYYLSHDIDKIIFQLNDKADVESFFLSIIHVMPSEYLKSEFWCNIWKFNNLSNQSLSILSKCYAELCVVHNIFNNNLAFYLMDMFFVDKNVREGFTIVCKLEEYWKFFEENYFSSGIIDKINHHLENFDKESIHLLNFLYYYDNITNNNFVGDICLNFINNFDQNNLNQQNNKLENFVENSNKIFIEKSPFIDVKNSSKMEFWKNYTKDSASTLIFAKELFSNVISDELKKEIIEKSLCLSKTAGYPEFIVECFFSHPKLVCSFLSSKYFECSAEWNSKEIVEILVKNDKGTQDISEAEMAFLFNILKSKNIKIEITKILHEFDLNEIQSKLLHTKIEMKDNSEKQLKEDVIDFYSQILNKSLEFNEIENSVFIKPESTNDVFFDLIKIFELVPEDCLSSRYCLIEKLISQEFRDYRIYLIFYLINPISFLNKCDRIFELIEEKKLLSKIIMYDLLKN